MGFYYVGPINGHDINDLVSVLKNAKEIKYEGPVMIHIKKLKKEKVTNSQKNLLINIMASQNLMLNTGIQEKIKSNVHLIRKFLQIL